MYSEFFFCFMYYIFHVYSSDKQLFLYIYIDIR